MRVFTKRNALVGFLTMKAASRALKRRRRRNGARIVLLVSLGLLSLGLLAGLAVVARRQRGEGRSELQVEGEAAEPVAAEPVAPEPVPAA
ncbi:MAG TPA: hypothetical protein VNK94_08440 [Gaiellaceae bacterium]|jgi:hypothetical protein|nr:hypothetical protein [Gaiellaceae bacterium]